MWRWCYSSRRKDGIYERKEYKSFDRKRKREAIFYFLCLEIELDKFRDEFGRNLQVKEIKRRVLSSVMRWRSYGCLGVRILEMEKDQSSTN